LESRLQAARLSRTNASFCSCSQRADASSRVLGMHLLGVERPLLLQARRLRARHRHARRVLPPQVGLPPAAPRYQSDRWPQVLPLQSRRRGLGVLTILLERSFCSTMPIPPCLVASAACVCAHFVDGALPAAPRATLLRNLRTCIDQVLLVASNLLAAAWPAPLRVCYDSFVASRLPAARRGAPLLLYFEQQTSPCRWVGE